MRIPLAPKATLAAVALALIASACGGKPAAPTPPRTPTPATPFPTPTPTQVAAAAIPAGAALNPRWVHTNPGRTVDIKVEGGEVADAVAQVAVELEFDPKTLQVEGLQRGRFMGTAPRLVAQDIDNHTGHGSFTFSTDAPKTPTAAGTIATLTVRVQRNTATGEYPLTIRRVTFIYGDKRELTTDSFKATIAVTALPTPTPTVTPGATPTGST
jgi:hypothetical protein